MGFFPSIATVKFVDTIENDGCRYSKDTQGPFLTTEPDLLAANFNIYVNQSLKYFWDKMNED